MRKFGNHWPHEALGLPRAGTRGNEDIIAFPESFEGGYLMSIGVGEYATALMGHSFEKRLWTWRDNRLRESLGGYLVGGRRLVIRLLEECRRIPQLVIATHSQSGSLPEVLRLYVIYDGLLEFLLDCLYATQL